jgi:CcmD family protein
MDPTPQPSATASASATPEGRSTEFRAVQGGDEMQSGTALLTEAYAAIWLLVLGLVLLGMRRVRRLEGRLDQLQGEVSRARGEEKKRAAASGEE